MSIGLMLGMGVRQQILSNYFFIKKRSKIYKLFNDRYFTRKVKPLLDEAAILTKKAHRRVLNIRDINAVISKDTNIKITQVIKF